MANRPKGYGMTADLQRKLAAKYDAELEKEARAWIEAVSGEGNPEPPNEVFGQKKFHEWLKNGQLLCKVINVLQPGSVKKINDSTMAFKMMENIGNFLDACEKYGVAKNDMFQTVDLYDGTNIVQVINGIHALGRKAQKNGYDGPVIGPREASTNRRDFTDEQLRAGEGVIGLQMGYTEGASQKGTSGFGANRDINWMDRQK